MRCTSYGALCAALLLSINPSVAEAGPIARQGLAPSAFVTVALPINTTPFDARWKRVLNSGLGAHTISDRASRLGGMERLRSVNTSTNQAITYRQDAANGLGSDYWANAGRTLANGFGDCEDYAIAKLQLLVSAGVPVRDIFLVIGTDLTLGSAHAMLLVHQAGRFWVLDSLSDQILPSEAYPDFRPIFSFGVRGAWVHGYAVEAATGSALTQQAPKPQLVASVNLAKIVAAQGR